MMTFLLFSIVAGVLSQSVGDYRSAGNGDFDQAGTWETYNGSSWVAAAAPPDENDGTVTIESGHIVNLDADHSISNLIVDGELIIEYFVELAVSGNIEVTSGGEIDVLPLGAPLISVQGNIINDGTIDFQLAYVVVAGNFTSTGITEMNASDDLGSIVVGGDVNGNFDFDGHAETHLIAMNPSASVVINPADSHITSIIELPFWVQVIIVFVFPEVNETINETIYGNPSPCPYTIVGPLNTVSCSGATVYLEITSTSAISPTYQWEVNDGGGWADVSDGGIYSGANTALLTISSAGASVDGYIYRCELEDASSCVKKSFTATLTILSDAAPSAPTTTGASGCINTSFTLSASGAAAGEDYFWYDAPAGGSWLQFSGPGYTTPVLSSTSTYYVSVYNTTSGCESERASVTATIVPPNTVGAASSTPTLCINNVLTNITHATTNATGIGAATGLPAGVTASWSSDEITISGTPTVSGPFNYSIPLTGGCGTVAATGTIVVGDFLPPIISCPPNRDEEADLSGNFLIPDYTGLVTVSDNCDPSPVLSQNPAIGTEISGVGTVESITISALDASGNSSQCTFDVTLTEQVVLSISCPENMDEYLDELCEFSIPDYRSLATVSGHNSLVQKPDIGTVLSGQGSVQAIVLTAYNAKGDSASCSFDITLLDTVSPSVICQDITVELDATGSAAIIADDIDAGSTDNCGIASIIVVPTSFSCADVGENPVTLQVTDFSGNISSCTAIVTVEDNIVPQISCRADTLLVSQGGSCSAVVNDLAPEFIEENCSLYTLRYRFEGATKGSGADDASGSEFNEGLTTVWYVIEDAGGNADSCSFVVELEISLLPPLSVSVDRDNICSGDGNVTLSYSGEEHGDGVSARWYDDALFTSPVGSGNNLLIEAPGTTSEYFVRFESLCDTTSAVSVTVTVNPVPVPVFTEAPEEVCINALPYLYEASGESGSTFSWEVSEGTIVEDLNESIYIDWGSLPGIGSVEVTEVSLAGCPSLPLSVDVNLVGPELDLGENQDLCEGESITISPDGDYTSYLWQDGSTGSEYTTDQEGWLTLEVGDESGCVATDSLFVSVVDLPLVNLGPDTTICSPDGIVLDAGRDGDRYLWSTGDMSQTIVVYNDGDQEIWVEVMNDQNCVGGDTVQIEFCNLSYFIQPPTGFTPNDDGENDVWNIYDLEAFDRAIVEVYDQWGTLVWKSEPGYPTPWDGFNMRGKLVPFDSYHFVISFNDGSKESYVGYVTVMH